ncbi:MAG: hypothetical protein HN336_03795 [Lentimicrobiaceae bacterium]|jgi:hypothetical protein|nr:hypothetical protein [Lentimicrobiaceae bacterium]MCP4909721.1 hypothetical protein [Bacteroidota bacterium]MBT3454240.1 hypothetical protein [Lentimicrobiaceae bacterium]MBT3817901.1 hypothetical protein [Lentimicrobiaceae bacterium]MBT4060652.1 hypothetical protein [Lentimicrobiaceae bacterium]
MSNDIIRTVGTILKREKLASVVHETKSKALILESLQPFPGYHGTTIPDKLEPEALFVVTRVKYHDEQIIRSTQKIKRICKINFDAVPGTLFIENKPVNIIRFKDLSYDMAGEIINYFIDEGIEFKKSRRISPYESKIYIRKFFNLKKVDDGIYEDLNMNEFFYLMVDGYPKWEVFEEITKNIKYNVHDMVFDAAQLSVYDTSGLIDFVRIYDQDRHVERLAKIRKYYEKAYSKLK